MRGVQIHRCHAQLQNLRHNVSRPDGSRKFFFGEEEVSCHQVKQGSVIRIEQCSSWRQYLQEVEIFGKKSQVTSQRISNIRIISASAGGGNKKRGEENGPKLKPTNSHSSLALQSVLLLLLLSFSVNFAPVHPRSTSTAHHSSQPAHQFPHLSSDPTNRTQVRTALHCSFRCAIWRRKRENVRHMLLAPSP